MTHYITKRKKKALMKAELEDYKKYKKLGFPKLAKDEKKHYNYIKKVKV